MSLSLSLSLLHSSSPPPPSHSLMVASTVSGDTSPGSVTVSTMGTNEARLELKARTGGFGFYAQVCPEVVAP